MRYSDFHEQETVHCWRCGRVAYQNLCIEFRNLIRKPGSRDTGTLREGAPACSYSSTQPATEEVWLSHGFGLRKNQCRVRYLYRQVLVVFPLPPYPFDRRGGEENIFVGSDAISIHGDREHQEDAVSISHPRDLERECEKKRLLYLCPGTT